MFSVVPYYLFGLILVYLLAFQWRVFPMSGSSQYGVVTSFSLNFAVDVVYHSILRRCRSFSPQWASGPSACAP